MGKRSKRQHGRRSAGPPRWPSARLSAERASARVDCPHPACDGCALIRVPYGEQLRRKGEAVARAFAPYPTLRRARRSAPIAAPRPDGYRRRVKLVVSRVGSEVRAGLYRRGTRDLLPIPACPITSTEVLNSVERICGALARHGGAAPEGPIKAVDLRQGAGSMALTLVLDRDEPDAGDLPIAALCEACPELQTVAVNPHPGRSPLALGQVTEVVWGEPRTEVHLEGWSQWLSPGVFFQIHAPQTEAIHHLLREFFGADGGRMLDLYCGSGTHALSLARRFERVVGVELAGDAVEDARHTARRRGLGHVEFEAADVRHDPADWLARGWDAVVVNPPRAGCAPAVRDAIADNPPRRLAYVSCNPVTLARDLHHLARRGFVVRRVTPVDMMPCTDQVECVALLEHQPGARDRGPHPGTERVEGTYSVLALLVDPLKGAGEVPANDLQRAGSDGTAYYDCLRIVAGHSLVRIDVEDVAPAALRRALRSFRHPVIGDEAAGVRSVNRFFGERFGLDRPFFQVVGSTRKASRLEPDLQAVLDQVTRRSR